MMNEHKKTTPGPPLTASAPPVNVHNYGKAPIWRHLLARPELGPDIVGKIHAMMLPQRVSKEKVKPVLQELKRVVCRKHTTGPAEALRITDHVNFFLHTPPGEEWLADMYERIAASTDAIFTDV